MLTPRTIYYQILCAVLMAPGGLLFAFESTAFEKSSSGSNKPNIVVIYADDLGYGDVSCFNPQRGKIPTPHIDRLASQGMMFYRCAFELGSLLAIALHVVDRSLPLANAFATGNCRVVGQAIDRA